MTLVADVMSHDVQSCRTEDSLGHVAQIMWSKRCGSVPVVDDEQRLVGIITDRDVAMGGASRGLPLHELDVATSMQTDVHRCHADDSADVPQRIMRENQVRRVPVVDDDQHLLGLVSLTDLGQWISREETQTRRRKRSEELVHTLTAVTRPHETPVPSWIPELEPVKVAKPKSAKAKATKTTGAKPKAAKTTTKTKRSS